LDPKEIEVHADLTADLLIRALEIHDSPREKPKKPSRGK
jgi:hypothetical protein